MYARICSWENLLLAYRLAAQGKRGQPNIDHELLREILSRVVVDPDVLQLADRVLESGEGVLSEEYRMVFFPADNLFAVFRPRGLPIGNLTSQFWANCYLNSFDHFVKRQLRCSGYVRYVDDLLLFANEKRTLWDWREAVVERLIGLRLVIHPGAQPKPVTEGIPFLGFTVFPHARRLKRRKGIHFRRRFRDLVDACIAGEVTLDQVTAVARGWVNHARYGNTVGLRTAILGERAIPGWVTAR